MADPQTQAFPFNSPAWKKNVETLEQEHVYKSAISNGNYWFTCNWPDTNDKREDNSARRWGHTTDPRWIWKIYPWFFDGHWHGSVSAEDTEALKKKKEESVITAPPRMPGTFDDPRADIQRFMSFWVSGGPTLVKGMTRIIDTKGNSEYGDMQLGLLIAYKMYEKREAWSNDFVGQPFTQEELGLETPLIFVEPPPREEVDKIVAFPKRLKDGAPEIQVRGTGDPRTSPPGPEPAVLTEFRENVAPFLERRPLA